MTESLTAPASGPRTNPRGPYFPLRGVRPSVLARNISRARLGFSPPEIDQLSEYFLREGRDPTVLELAGIAQSWSEHCSYKSSRPLLRKHFGSLPPHPRVLGRGDAGVMALGQGRAYALRIESHNHPSAVEPYGGAATGIGGILRDVLAVGARPVALADPLFFGPLDLPADRVPRGMKHPRYLYENVVAGIRDYGNRVGVPTLAGSVTFDPAYLVNPLVNVACVGLLPVDHLIPNRSTQAGERLVLVGGLTGRDGIGGVAFASRELSRRSETESRGAVQLGNPIMKEPLIRACLECIDEGLIRGMKDLGGGGIATCSGELVHAGGLGSQIHLDRVPLREPDLAPWEIWVSESQERMLLSVEPRHLAALLEVFDLHDVPATEVGEVVPGHEERIYFEGDLVGALDLPFRIEAPEAVRPVRRPTASPNPGVIAPVRHPLDRVLRKLLLSPDALSREPVIRLYDHQVQGRTVGTPFAGEPWHPSHADAAILRVDPEGTTGLALAVGSAPFVCALDPLQGGRAVVEEAARNLYAVGARPDAFTNCLNFGNPEDPSVLGSFDAVLEGMADVARSLELAVPSGNVSFYNGGLGSDIPPTPVVLATGILEDFRTAVSSDLKAPGHWLYLLGPTYPDLGGSLYARTYHVRARTVGHYDPQLLRRMGEAILRLGQRRAISSCHDLGEGGLALALAEMAFGGGMGFDVDLGAIPSLPSSVAALSEAGSRWVLEVDPGRADEVEEHLAGLPWTRLGTVTAEGGIFREREQKLVELDLGALYGPWRQGLAHISPAHA